MSDKKIFLLGVGCQKGGTSWLHKYLHGHQNCDFGFRKEYHVFDAIHLKGEKRFRKKAVRNFAKLADRIIDGKVKFKGSANPSTQMQLVDFYRSTDSYFNYFHGLAHRSDETKVVGDITPSYAGLPQKVFEDIKSNLEDRNFDVRVVFLMRDPVERIYSAARMSMRDARASGKPVTRTENETFLDLYAERKSDRRSRYDATIKILDDVFEQEKIYYGFYEDLFEDAQVKSICDFLNIGYVAPNFQERVNSSAQTEELSEANAKIARDHFAETYDFVQARFPEKDLKKLWQYL